MVGAESSTVTVGCVEVAVDDADDGGAAEVCAVEVVELAEGPGVGLPRR